jgi:hypothetical protein
MNGILKEHFLGECGICYKELFLEANHIVTECKHLFCIKSILKWYNLSNTCPICRDNLYENTWDEPEYTDISLGNIYLEFLKSTAIVIVVYILLIGMMVNLIL